MTSELAFLDALRALAPHPGARGLMDDAAVLPSPVAADLVLTHDMLVEGVHYLPTDPAGDVAWKLVAVNLSDLAAKGASPLGVLMGYALGGDDAWDAAFLVGLGEALRAFDVSLLGGDTVSMPSGAPRALGLTALGTVPPGGAPARSGAKAGDRLWVTGTIGNAGIGLSIARGQATGARSLLDAYRRPVPPLAAGRAIAPITHAMADISDGLLIDAARMATASRLAVTIDLDAVPLSDAARALAGDDRAARLAAATAGDDYELLVAAPPHADAALLTLCQAAGVTMACVGHFAAGTGLTLVDRVGAVPLPERLGYEHGASIGGFRG
ncbi:MAG: thiamine-monophosphate kinase [Sphingomonas bacterium]|nr:thiamine-monophosphate kinase [Sphingomonas bacterium]